MGGLGLLLTSPQNISLSLMTASSDYAGCSTPPPGVANPALPRPALPARPRAGRGGLRGGRVQPGGGLGAGGVGGGTAAGQARQGAGPARHPGQARHQAVRALHRPSLLPAGGDGGEAALQVRLIPSLLALYRH